MIAQVDAAGIERALTVLASGGVVAIPTDTVYGLTCRACDTKATERVFALKGRTQDVNLPVLISSAGQAEKVTGDLVGGARSLVDLYWPGPLTVVVRRVPGIEWSLGASRSTVGLRCPDHPVVRELCTTIGPLAATSANRHGREPLQCAVDIEDEFGVDIGLVLDGGRIEGVASTVVDLTRDPPVCLREGAVPWSDVEAALSSPTWNTAS